MLVSPSTARETPDALRAPETEDLTPVDALGETVRSFELDFSDLDLEPLQSSVEGEGEVTEQAPWLRGLPPPLPKETDR